MPNDKLADELEAMAETERQMMEMAESEDIREIHMFAMTVMYTAAWRIRRIPSETKKPACD